MSCFFSRGILHHQSADLIDHVADLLDRRTMIIGHNRKSQQSTALGLRIAGEGSHKYRGASLSVNLASRRRLTHSMFQSAIDPSDGANGLEELALGMLVHILQQAREGFGRDEIGSRHTRSIAEMQIFFCSACFFKKRFNCL